jgi:DNA-binding protein YbaB
MTGEEQEITGHGTAADGLITVTVSADGRVSELRLDPRALRRGPVTDAAGLADEIKQAVNAALADFDQKVKDFTGDLAGELAAGLDELAEGFEQAMEQMATDIARTHRRLED